MTTAKKEWVDQGLVHALEETSAVEVLEVHPRILATVLVKRELLVDEARFLARLVTSRRYYRHPLRFVSLGGHYAVLCFARFLSLFRRSPPQVFLLNFYLHSLGESRLVQAILQGLLTENVYVVGQSVADVQYFRRFLPESNVVLIRYGMDRPTTAEPPEQIEPGFIFSGGWTNRDYGLLFGCAEELHNERFVVVASAKSDLPPAPANVRVFRDLPIDQFHGLMKSSRIVVVPLMGDVGSSGQMVAGAGMLFGKLVIAARIGAITDYIVDGRNGLLYTLGDPRSLLYAIKRGLHEPGLAQRIARTAEEDAAKFSNAERSARLREHILSYPMPS